MHNTHTISSLHQIIMCNNKETEEDNVKRIRVCWISNGTGWKNDQIRKILSGRPSANFFHSNWNHLSWYCGFMYGLVQQVSYTWFVCSAVTSRVWNKICLWTFYVMLLRACYGLLGLRSWFYYFGEDICWRCSVLKTFLLETVVFEFDYLIRSFEIIFLWLEWDKSRDIKT